MASTQAFSTNVPEYDPLWVEKTGFNRLTVSSPTSCSGTSTKQDCLVIDDGRLSQTIQPERQHCWLPLPLFSKCLRQPWDFVNQIQSQKSGSYDSTLTWRLLVQQLFLPSETSTWQLWLSQGGAFIHEEMVKVWKPTGLVRNSVFDAKRAKSLARAFSAG